MYMAIGMKNHWVLRVSQCFTLQLMLWTPTLSQIPVVTPLAKVASLDNDTQHIFVCEGNSSIPGSFIAVFVDEKLSNHQDILNRGITAVSSDNGNNNYISTITIPASSVNNDTKIKCDFITDERRSSEVATFLVQGLLEASETELVSLNNSHLSFSWIPPFSLDITDSDPDILFYIFNESLTPNSQNVSDVQQFIFPVLAVSVEFSVSAWNIVGEGERTTVAHQPCSLSEDQQQASVENMKREVIYQDNGRFILSLSIPWTVDCFPLFSLELTEHGSEEEDKILHDRLVPIVTVNGGEKMIDLLVPLQNRENTLYTAQLTSISSQRSVSAQLTISTHDVQSVEITFTTSSITITCLFATGSQAQGCSILLSLIGDTQSNPMNIPVIREVDDQGLPLIVQETVENLKSGVYTVIVYDIESNGVTKTDREPAHNQTIDITQPTTQPPSTSTSSSTSSSSSTTPVAVSTDELNRDNNGSDNAIIPIIAGAIIGGALLISLVLLILVSVVVLKRRRKKEKDTESRGGEFVLIAATGGTISSESVDASGYLSPAHTLQVSSSSIQSHTLPSIASSSIQKTTLSKKESLPPAYSDLEPTVCAHVRSMSDVVTTSSSRRNGDVESGPISQDENHSQSSNTENTTTTSSNTNQNGSQKRAVEATLSAPPTSPPPPLPQISPRLVLKNTSHTHLMRHERSSSLGGPHPLYNSSSAIPPHLPKKTRPRAPPVSSSFSTSALLPPRLTSPPVSFSLSSLSIPQETTAETSSTETNNAVGKNPLYDTAAALLLKKEEKRRSIHYTEVVPRTGDETTPTNSAPLLPHDNTLVLYSEVNINELVPRLPHKKSTNVPLPTTNQTPPPPTDELL